jgi:hypothetical protein
MSKIGGVMMCENAKHALSEDVMEVMNAFMMEWLYGYYYVWKMTRQRRVLLPMAGDTRPMPLHDIRLWEVVCEDDHKQILCHPLLPHPSDFLEKRVVDKTSTLYVDKARFEYQIPGSLSRFPVVLLPGECSILPRMAPAPLYQEETVHCGWKKPTPQIFYSETSTSHKNRSQPRKKRRLSKILKESRKKNKTLRTGHRHMYHIGIDDGYDDGMYAYPEDPDDHKYDDNYGCCIEW